MSGRIQPKLARTISSEIHVSVERVATSDTSDTNRTEGAAAVAADFIWAEAVRTFANDAEEAARRNSSVC